MSGGYGLPGCYPLPARVPPGALLGARRHQPARRDAEILFSDTAWRPCTILAWARYRGGWAALVRWHSGAQDWHVFDGRFIRARNRTLGGQRHQGCSGFPRPRPAYPMSRAGSR